MDKHVTKIVLGAISVVDCAMGSHGAVTLALWFLYGLYKVDRK